MIVIHEIAVFDKSKKPVICPKCTRGTLGYIPIESEAVLSKRGKPPPDGKGHYLQVKCFICRSLWEMSIEN